MNLIKSLFFAAVFMMAGLSSAALLEDVHKSCIPVDSISSETKYHNITLFDPSLGELERVNLTVDLDFIQNLWFENLGEANRTFLYESTAELLITTPNKDQLSVNASISVEDDVAGFDGEEDFQGPSGRIMENVTSNSSTSVEYPDISDFIATVPGETKSLPAWFNFIDVIPATSSSAFGTESLAGSNLSVTYAYEPENSKEGR